MLPPAHGQLAATYEVRHGEGPDQPLAAAAVSLQGRSAKYSRRRSSWDRWPRFHGVRRRQPARSKARFCPRNPRPGPATRRWRVPWPCRRMSTRSSWPRVAVKRAILRAAGLETGGLDRPMTSESITIVTREPSRLVREKSMSYQRSFSEPKVALATSLHESAQQGNLRHRQSGPSIRGRGG